MPRRDGRQDPGGSFSIWAASQDEIADLCAATETKIGIRARQNRRGQPGSGSSSDEAGLTAGRKMVAPSRFQPYGIANW